jgi:hypothetical protein
MMVIKNQPRLVLRCAILSAAMLMIAGPAARADPPGYLFLDFEHSAPDVISAPVAPQQRSAAKEEKHLHTSAQTSVPAPGSRIAREIEAQDDGAGVLLSPQ